MGPLDVKIAHNILDASLQDQVLDKIKFLLNSFIKNETFIKHISLIYGNIITFEKFFTKFKNLIESLEEDEQNPYFLDAIYEKLSSIENTFNQLCSFITTFNSISTARLFDADMHKTLQLNWDFLKKYYSQLKLANFALEDINKKIEKITNQNVSFIKQRDFLPKIKKYFRYAADPKVGKVVKMKYLSKPKQLDFPYNLYSLVEDERTSEIAVINKFNQLFINNCHYILIAAEDQKLAENSLKLLQQSIIHANCKLNNIDGLKNYGDLIINKIIAELSNYFICNNYATQVLIEHYFRSFVVIECIKYDSSFCLQHINNLINVLIKIHDKSTGFHQKLALQYMSYVAHTFAYFDNKTFQSFLNENERAMQVFFQEIFRALLQEFKENRSLGKTIDKILNNLFKYLVVLHNNNKLFEFIKKELTIENYSTMTDILSIMFSDILSYGIDLNNYHNVQHCFRPWFFHILINHQRSSILFDKFNSNLTQLLFYVGIDDESVPVAKNNLERKDEFDELLAYITAEFTYRSRYDRSEKSNLENLVELLKKFAGVGSLNTRAIIAQKWLNKVLVLRTSEEYIEKFIVQELIAKSNGGYEKKLYKVMAELGCLHLLKEVVHDRVEVISRLKKANVHFSRYCDCLEKIKQPFDIAAELNQDFNLPYHLSLNFNSRDLAAEDVGLMMLILYRIFSRSQGTSKDHAALIQDLRYYFEEISRSSKRLLVFYNAAIVRARNNHARSEYIAEYCSELKQTSLSSIIDGFTEQGTESLSERVDKARLIVDNAINYKFNFIEQVVAKELKIDPDPKLTQQTINSFFNEIKEILTTTLQRNGKDLQKWTHATSSIGEKIAFLCAKYKYSENEFKECFLKLNQNKEGDEILNAGLIQADLVSKHVKEHQNIFNKIDIKHLQHNQRFALSMIYQFLARNKIENIFMQIGTGQGKSIIIAETARKMLDLGEKQVFIFTCYSHLAVRDYQKFKPYFEHFGIEAICCSEEILTESKKQDLELLLKSKIIYANLHSYFDLIREERLKLLQGKQGLKFPDYKQAVLIMDEFDSLILDSDEINQKIGNFYIGKASIEDVRNKQKIKKLLGEDFIKKMHQLDPKLFDHWYGLELLKLSIGYRPSFSESSLGITSGFVGSFLQRLSDYGFGQFIYCYLDPLVFYREFKYMVGFSGSINKESMQDLSDIFSGKENHYYEIPPFYGIEKLHQNRKFTNDPGQMLPEEEAFLNAVVAEVKEQKGQNRPVLIFSDLKLNRNEGKTSDFELIQARLKKEEFLDHKQFNIIKTEKDLEKLPYIGKESAVTLASRILARGADIKVDGHIKEGLHLILTYYPPRKNIYVQMLGRTARQDDKGSYAEITREKCDYYESKSKITKKQEELYEISEYFFSTVDHRDHEHNKAKWPLLLDALFAKDHIEGAKIKNFINKNFKCKI